MGCSNGLQLERSDVDGQTRDLLGLVDCQENDEQVWSGANRTDGYAKFVVARELEKRLVRAQRDRHEHEHGRHGHEVPERHNWRTVLAVMLLCFRCRDLDGYDGGRIERQGQTSNASTAYATMAPYDRGSFNGKSLLVGSSCM